VWRPGIPKRPIDILYVAEYPPAEYLQEDSTTSKTDLLQGTLDLLILRALLLQPDHGLGITRRIQQITRGTFDVKPGSLFPALHRLEEKGWLASQWGESENRRRAKYYTLTAVGRREIDAEVTNWQRIVAAIGWAIKATS
jgi:PadR family transcriptional regulator PadR